jgi:hypothetical protein
MKTKKTGMITLLFGIIGGILVIGTAIIQYTEKNNEKHEKEIQEKKADKYQHELILSLKENVKLSNELYKYTVGGNSFCYMELYPKDKKNTFYIMFLLEGKYPLRHVTAKITEQKGEIDTTVASNFKNIMSIGELNEQQNIYMTQDYIVFPEGEITKLLVQFSTASGHFMQLIRMKKVNDKWCFATEVKDLMSGKVLHKEIETCYGEDEAEIFN